VTIRPSGGLSQREIVEIITRRRQEASHVGIIPGGGVRVTTQEHMIAKPDDEDK
jgi:hypothetical protein